QSININNVDKYINQAREISIYNFEQFIYFNNFRLGNGADLDEMTYYRHLKDILCTNDCEVYNYLQDKLEGKLKTKKYKKRSISEIIINLRKESGEEIDVKNYWSLKDW